MDTVTIPDQALRGRVLALYFKQPAPFRVFMFLGSRRCVRRCPSFVAVSIGQKSGF